MEITEITIKPPKGYRERMVINQETRRAEIAFEKIRLGDLPSGARAISDRIGYVVITCLRE